MRKFISIVEARAKAPPVDPAVQAQRIYDRGLTVAKAVSHRFFIRQWDQEWVVALRNLITDARQAHDKNEAEEIEYDNSYKGRPFSLDVEHVTQQWWQTIVVPHLSEIESAAKHEYERYQDSKPNVEQSDQMTLHQAEIELATTIANRGNDSLVGMDAVLSAFDSFNSTIEHLVDINYHGLATRETQDFATKIIPSILAICRLHGAKPA